MSTVAAAWIALTGQVALAADPPADCASVTTNESVIVALEAAVSAYDKLEIEQFEASTEASVTAVRCLGEALDRANAAELHRALGMVAFVDRDEEASKRSFAAARAIEPAYTFPVSRVPEGNPIRQYYTAIDPALLAVETAPWPKQGSVRIDGSAERQRIVGLPAVFQQLDREGAVMRSTLLGAEEPLPTYEIRTTDPYAKRGPKKSTFIAGLAVGAAAGGVYGGALLVKRSYTQADTVAQVTRQRPVANGLAVTSGALGAVAVGLGTVSFIQGTF